MRVLFYVGGLKLLGATRSTLGRKKKANSHCQNCHKSGRKWIFRPAEENSHRYADQSQQVLQFVSIDVLPRGSSSFGHDPSLGVPQLIPDPLKNIRAKYQRHPLDPLVNAPDSKLSDPC